MKRWKRWKSWKRWKWPWQDGYTDSFYYNDKVYDEETQKGLYFVNGTWDWRDLLIFGFRFTPFYSSKKSNGGGYDFLFHLFGFMFYLRYKSFQIINCIENKDDVFYHKKNLNNLLVTSNMSVLESIKEISKND